MNPVITLSGLLFLSSINIDWREVHKGVDLAQINLSELSEYDGLLYIIRIDPTIIKPDVLIGEELNQEPITAREWCEKYNLNIVMNLGMYHKDLKTHVGYLRNGEYINNPKWNNYKSALVMGPRRKGIKPVDIIDLDNEKEKTRIDSYKTVVQNLRLIKGNGINVWEKTSREWSEAAIGIDRDGNLLLFFTSTPITMYNFNEIILKLPLKVIKAFHTDGGPPASLSINYGKYHINLSGNSLSEKQEPIPNIIGFRIGH